MPVVRQWHRSAVFALAAGTLVLAWATHVAIGGIVGGFGNRAVGGVMIDAGGNVRVATPEEQRDFAALVDANTDPIRDGFDKAVDLRVVSLSALRRSVEDAIENHREISDELEYLGGLQRIDYVWADPDNNDVCIAGPAEPWKVSDDGSVVGTRSGLSPLRLVDLLVAFQSVEPARNGGISCSIEPTSEGRHKLQTLLRGVRLRSGQSPASLEPAMRQAFGPQMIKINGVGRSSRLARTMVAADFEMKRIAMGLAPSPIASLPSYLSMAKNQLQSGNSNPRWWMACDYQPIARDADKRVWKLSGNRVRTMTETDLVDGDGNAKRGNRDDKMAQAWADRMTESYDELAAAIPVFGDLENAMDLAVATTLIVQENLAEQAGMDLRWYTTTAASLEPVQYPIPESVDPQCSFIRGSNGWVVTASGGVDISGFSVVENQTVQATLNEQKETFASTRPQSGSWWWNVR